MEEKEEERVEYREYLKGEETVSRLTDPESSPRRKVLLPLGYPSNLHCL